jgi:uncharacterized protein (DUF58 family)
MTPQSSATLSSSQRLETLALVPSTRLIASIAVIVLPCAAIGGTVPAAFGVAAFFVSCLFAIVLLDAVLAPTRLAGIRVVLPELARLQKDQEANLKVCIHNATKISRPLRIGLAFPREIQVAEDARLTLLPAGAELSQLDWSCTPRKRGQYFLDRAWLEVASPLGFWEARSSHSARAELRVYPNMFNERKHVAAHFLKRGPLGVHAQRQAGQGRDFEKLREYLPGDSVDEIHWKATAKRGHPVTKVFQIERTQEVYVILDASRLTARTVKLDDGTETNVLERFVTAALILGLAAEQKGDQFGLLTFSDRVLSFVRAKNGQSHYDACRDRLYTLHPQIVTPDFDELATFLRLRLRKRALLIFLTALDDPMLADSFVKNVNLICRQHLIIVDMLRPPGAVPLFSDDKVGDLDDIYRHLGGHWQWHKLLELEKVLQRRGVRFSLLDPSRLPAQLVAQHAEVKARQLI